MNPLVSVIIPVYNVKPYLREALDSVIDQTYKKIEIIIVDDGSTDGSEIICDEYSSDLRVTVIHQKNGGLSNARNTGLNLIKGDYVCFLDPDDAYQPTFIEKMVDKAQSARVEMVICKFTLLKTTGKLVRKERGYKSIFPLFTSDIYSNVSVLRNMVKGELGVSTWNKLYKADLWNNIRFPEGRNYEDIDTMYLIVDSCKTISIIDETLYYKRDRYGSITHDYSAKNAHDLMSACTNLETFIVSHHPEVFNDELVGRFKQWNLNVYMVFFAQCSEENRLRDEMRELIMKKGREMSRWNVRTKVAYLMVCYTPRLFSHAYKIYLPCRLLIWKVIGR